jgi:hypothetical protein
VSDDWKVGDLALCVYAGDNWSSLDASNEASPAPQFGCTYTVLHVGTCQGLLGIGLVEFGPMMTFYAPRFRKIRPDANRGSKREWRKLLNKHRQKVPA